jgi:hypothetical protein
MNKDTKIWGMSFSLIGDLIAGLPQLNYFEKKYPGSYKYWGIHKKMSHAAPLFYNHPLIDRIKITDTWGGFGENDYELASQCEFTTRQLDHKNKTLLNARPEDYWYNDHDIVEQLARMSGIYDIQEILTEEELRPQLSQWFEADFDFIEKNEGYTKSRTKSNLIPSKSIVIWPFSGYGHWPSRSPSTQWWNTLVDTLVNNNFTIFHCGWIEEPHLSNLDNYVRCVNLPFFEQIKISLATKLAVGADSGSMWTLGAYSHPAIHLMTNWRDGHTTNFSAMNPVNIKGISYFAPPSSDQWPHNDILNNIWEIIK